MRASGSTATGSAVAPRSGRITAIDVKDEQVADCNAFFQRIGRPQVKFEVGDVTKFTKPEAFELVVCVDVMEHILEDEAALRCYSTSLKPGGMLIISTPSDQGGSDVHEEGEGSFIEEHVRDGYNIDDIRAKCLRNGFSKVEARYSYGAPGKISWKLSMKWPLADAAGQQAVLHRAALLLPHRLPHRLRAEHGRCAHEARHGNGVDREGMEVRVM